MMIRTTEEYSRRKFGQMRRPAAVLSKNGGNKSQICLPPSLPEFVKSSFHGNIYKLLRYICLSKDSQVKPCHWNKNRFQAETICRPVVAFIFLSPCCRGASRKEGTRDRRALQLRRGLTHTSCCVNDPSANKEHNAQVFWALLPATARQHVVDNRCCVLNVEPTILKMQIILFVKYPSIERQSHCNENYIPLPLFWKYS